MVFKLAKKAINNGNMENYKFAVTSLDHEVTLQEQQPGYNNGNMNAFYEYTTRILLKEPLITNNKY